VLALLLLHAGMVIPGIFRNSITFDENFHLPAGALFLARGYTHVSIGQPPLARALYALPVMALHPKLPPDSILAINAERAAGHSFLALNAGRFEALYWTGRFVALLLSLGLGLLIFGFARELYGEGGGLLALGAWAAMPEAVAQAGLIGMDLPTALVFLVAVMALRRLVLHGAVLDVLLLALGFGAALLTRYSALQLVPILIGLAAWAILERRAKRPALLLWGLPVAFLAGLLVLDAGYLFQATMMPLGKRALNSAGLKAMAHRLPGLRLPLPEAYIAGFDYLRWITESFKPIFLFGHTQTENVWWYFPLAAAVKWPLGLIGLAIARTIHSLRRLGRPGWDTACTLVPALCVIGIAMISDLSYGLRYLLPAMPFLCVWFGGLVAPPAPEPAAVSRAAPRARPRASAWARVAVALFLAQAIECGLATPWQLSHFNPLAGGRGPWIVNDSSVDWGQGLIALRDEMKARGIRRVLLSYHGTTDPALYGIDYVPYQGGQPDPTLEWLAVSSYYFVGLTQRMVTPRGDTDFLGIDFRPFWGITPAAMPANCIYLFRIARATR
jgi:hypothetical protein